MCCDCKIHSYLPTETEGRIELSIAKTRDQSTPLAYIMQWLTQVSLLQDGSTWPFKRKLREGGTTLYSLSLVMWICMFIGNPTLIYFQVLLHCGALQKVNHICSELNLSRARQLQIKLSNISLTIRTRLILRLLRINYPSRKAGSSKQLSLFNKRIMCLCLQCFSNASPRDSNW